MPSIGDLANDIAHALYEARILVAAVSVVALVAVVVVARRLGWFAAARRHPRRTAAAVAVAVALIAPVGWDLGSPHLTRPALVEAGPDPAAVTPTPVAAATAGPVRSPGPTPATTPATTPSPLPTPSPFVARTVSTGSFVGTDEFHFGRGTARIIEVEPGRFHLRLEEFSVRNGPDLYVYLSPEPDAYDPVAVELGRLKATDGAFGYDLPAGTDPATFRSALIWCKQFSHLFAYATLAVGA